MAHFSLAFDTKINMTPILCTESFVAEQLMQPLSQNCYDHALLNDLLPNFLKPSESAENDKMVGSLYSIVGFDDDGLPMLNHFEQENGGWLVLVLKYILKVSNNLSICFISYHTTCYGRCFIF